MSAGDLEAAVVLYGRAFLVAETYKRYRLRVPWPDRPSWIPENFGEDVMGILARRLRRAWPAGHDATEGIHGIDRGLREWLDENVGLIGGSGYEH